MSGNCRIKEKLSQEEKEVAITHVANILGRTFDEVTSVYTEFATPANLIGFECHLSFRKTCQTRSSR